MGCGYKKTHAMISLDPHSLNQIAKEIRDLEAKITLQFGFQVSLAITKAGLKDNYRLRPVYQKQYINDVKDFVCKQCLITPRQLTSPKRDGGLPQYRYLCYQLIKDEFPKIGLAHIGKYFGGRDHSTVLHGLKVFSETVKTDEKLQDIYQSIKQKINEKRKSNNNIDTFGTESDD
jgi:chromosomal replication initiation ATPase DnaA